MAKENYKGTRNLVNGSSELDIMGAGSKDTITSFTAVSDNVIDATTRPADSTIQPKNLLLP